MLRTINGKKIEITEGVIEEIRAMCDRSEGADYDELFEFLHEQLGINVDRERADALFKMNFVNSVLSSIGGKGENKEIFSARVKGGGQRNWSIKVLPKEILDKIIASYEKTLEKLEGRIMKVRRKIIDLTALKENRVLFDDGPSTDDIRASIDNRTGT